MAKKNVTQVEKRHRWIGTKPNHAAVAKAGRELGRTVRMERDGTLTPDYTWLDDLPDAADETLLDQPGEVQRHQDGNDPTIPKGQSVKKLDARRSRRHS
jgi:hypothetical protein